MVLEGFEKSRQVAGLRGSGWSARDESSGTDLGFAFPVLDVLECASAAGIEILARLDKHVGGRDYIDDGGLAGVVSGQPDGDGDVVGCLAVGDGEEAVDTEEELGPAVIKGWRARQWGLNTGRPGKAVL